jgi:hypothetical protein
VYIIYKKVDLMLRKGSEEFLPSLLHTNYEEAL